MFSFHLISSSAFGVYPSVCVCGGNPCTKGLSSDLLRRPNFHSVLAGGDRVAAWLSPTTRIWSLINPTYLQFFIMSFSEGLFSFSVYRTESVSAVSSKRVHHSSFKCLLCRKRPKTEISRSLDGKQSDS